MSTYEYDDTDFLNDTFNEDKLTQEIAANETITTELDFITSTEDVDTGDVTVTFHFPTTLSAGEVTALDSLVAAHDGSPPTQVIWHASSVLTDQESSVSDTTPDWTELGGTVTTPDFFTDNPQNCKGRVVGLVKSNGTGGKLRLKEGTRRQVGATMSLILRGLGRRCSGSLLTMRRRGHIRTSSKVSFQRQELRSSR